MIFIILHRFSHRILSVEFRKHSKFPSMKRCWIEWTMVRKFGIQFLVIHFKLYLYGWSSSAWYFRRCKKIRDAFYSQGVRQATYDMYLETLYPQNLTHTWQIVTVNCSLFIPRTQQNEKIYQKVKNKFL